MEKKRTTVYDVAKKATVSTATVSRYLNGMPVKRETRMRISDAIQALDFSPNRVAQALKTERTNLIMMVVPDISNQYYSEMYKVVQGIASSQGYACMLVNTNEKVEDELRALELVREHHCDGVIFCSVFRSAEMDRRLMDLRIPFVKNDSRSERGYDTEERIYLTTRHLIDLGHRHIIYVGGARNTFINISRRNGFIQAMEEANLDYNADEWFEMDFTMEAGHKAGRYLSTLTPMPTAVCAANDQLAFGIMMALKECNLRVPEDISITGMDDVDFARLISPPLTTTRNDSKKFAQFAIEEIMRKINGKAPLPDEEPEQATLIIRGSTKRL